MSPEIKTTEIQNSDYKKKSSDLHIAEALAKPGAALKTALSLIHNFINSVMDCENIFTAPPHPHG